MGLSSSVFGCILSTLLLLCISKSQAKDRVFDIMQFGGKSDGITDNSKALSTAWDQGCKYDGSAVILIPQGTFMVFPLILQGPCHGSIKLKIDGKVLAPTDLKHFAKDGDWLALHHVTNLFVDGQGSFDGQGSSSWNSSKSERPNTLKFSSINNATIRNIRSVNSKSFHFSVLGSENMMFDNVTLIAPGNSPNTDGIHISMSTRINIFNSVKRTGDDCISMGPGSIHINITNVDCGPGHGISIGSLGKYPKESDVSEITVRHSIFKNTDNGVRIKSWSNLYSSKVTKVSFINLHMDNVQNPIIIDQNYCPDNSCKDSSQNKSRVQIQDVRYEGIRGTSKSKEAVQFHCSQINPCKGIVLKDIKLILKDGGSVTSSSSCNHVTGSALGVQIPPSCL